MRLASSVVRDMQRTIHGWLFEDLVFERHTGEPPYLPPHAHDAYQVGTTTRDPGEYLCEGRKWIAPPGSMMVFHPGAVHSAEKIGVRSRSAVSRLVFIGPGRMREIAAAATGKADLPRFPDLVVRDEGFIRRFCAFHDLVMTDASLLEKESCLVATFSELVRRFAAPSGSSRRREPRADVRVVREYIAEHYAENVSLSRLADLAGISPYHLSRVFTQEVGMPPHAFQTQVRVERAKSLLLSGMSATDAAVATGFFDQSHFTRHFRRIVGVAPSSYVAARRRSLRFNTPSLEVRNT